MASSDHATREAAVSESEPATVDVVVSINDEITSSTPMALDGSKSLADQVDAACELLGATARSAADYVLLGRVVEEDRPEYLTAEMWLDGVPPWLEPGATLELVPQPSIEVREVLEQLSESDDDAREPADQREQRKRRVFWMRERLRIAAWTEEFVAQDGLALLLQLMQPSAASSAIGDASSGTRSSIASGGGALQAYCLLALRQALCWQCAMAELCASAENVHLLFRLLYSGTLKVVSRALELLFVCASADVRSFNEHAADTYTTMLAAATAAAHVRAPLEPAPARTLHPARAGQHAPHQMAQMARASGDR